MHLADLIGLAIVLLYWSLWYTAGTRAYTKTPGLRMLWFILSWLFAGLPGFIAGLIVGRLRARRAPVVPTTGSAQLPT
jgi:hypothetical protein